MTDYAALTDAEVKRRLAAHEAAGGYLMAELMPNYVSDPKSTLCSPRRIVLEMIDRQQATGDLLSMTEIEELLVGQEDHYLAFVGAACLREARARFRYGSAAATGMSEEFAHARDLARWQEIYGVAPSTDVKFKITEDYPFGGDDLGRKLEDYSDFMDEEGLRALERLIKNGTPRPFLVAVIEYQERNKCVLHDNRAWHFVELFGGKGAWAEYARPTWDNRYSLCRPEYRGNEDPNDAPPVTSPKAS